MLDRLGNRNNEQVQTIQGLLTDLEGQNTENRLNFIAHAQHVNVPKVLRFTYLDTLKQALRAKDHASLELLLDIPNFRLVEGSAFGLPVKAANDGNLEALQLLLDTPGMNVNQIYLAQNPLHAATEKGHAHIVEHLLQRVGIEPDRKGYAGKTALDIAKEKNHQPIVELLESHKAK